MQTVGESLQRVNAGSVERSHIPETQDHDVCKRLQISGGFVKLLGGSEKKRAMDAEDGHVCRNALSWRMWAWPSRRYSRVTGATVVVSAMR